MDVRADGPAGLVCNPGAACRLTMRRKCWHIVLRASVCVICMKVMTVSVDRDVCLSKLHLLIDFVEIKIREMFFPLVLREISEKNCCLRIIALKKLAEHHEIQILGCLYILKR